MLTACPAPVGADRHCLHVVAEPQAHAMLRLLEPFVIHDVLPHRVDTRADAEALHLTIIFHASQDLAERLRARLAVMVPVHHAELLSGELPVSAAA